MKGTDLQDLFETAALALMHLLLKGRSNITPSVKRLDVSADDLEDLMVRWLSEILYLFCGESEVVTGVKVPVIHPSRLDAIVETVPLDPKRHDILREIKAVTYHQIEVSQKNDLWKARIIFDV